MGYLEMVYEGAAVCEAGERRRGEERGLNAAQRAFLPSFNHSLTTFDHFPLF